MGVGSSMHDAMSSLSPWTTSISIDNQTNSPVIVLLAHSAEHPNAGESEKHEIPANTVSAISSGWLNVPKATLLVRTGVDHAQIIRAPHATRLLIKIVPHGLAVETLDSGVEFEEYPDPGAVPNHDTIPMVLRNEHFHDRAPLAMHRHQSVAHEVVGTTSHMSIGGSVHDAVSSLSPWTTSISVDNQTNAPVIAWLARSAEHPSPSDAVQHVFPANTVTGVSSGWLHVPKATLLIRTGVDSAQVIRAPHATKLIIKVVPHGLTVETFDSGVDISEYPEPHTVPGHDTIPMVMRHEHFDTQAPHTAAHKDQPALVHARAHTGGA
mmetsp:Transcript_81889/g.171305  ORF Transcript_81889/g.171305 Transcript_81889/m.171305 type:complete len:323 (-) Transcript_81889:929-1897(-)|eukprot:CAMPEP_0206447824 /NCGR_PEP_ID=MMETSP0324_2-20121206/17071_1 /ASSEMBLY_ACC=CAM_ASM_000836 /TAXON_ID=2866 /ORGANISM="Crypthecodinium cohnii, Strain Seligo" /LENGTH=322 /DNA_ID=CAMNT_0053916779 /DNA_START=185 /DNA_END=1153 /DNA_ORIENTATION=-